MAEGPQDGIGGRAMMCGPCCGLEFCGESAVTSGFEMVGTWGLEPQTSTVSR
jgi:hypothetical protein